MISGVFLCRKRSEVELYNFISMFLKTPLPPSRRRSGKSFLDFNHEELNIHKMKREAIPIWLVILLLCRRLHLGRWCATHPSVNVRTAYNRIVTIALIGACFKGQFYYLFFASLMEGFWSAHHLCWGSICIEAASGGWLCQWEIRRGGLTIFHLHRPVVQGRVFYTLQCKKKKEARTTTLIVDQIGSVIGCFLVPVDDYWCCGVD